MDNKTEIDPLKDFEGAVEDIHMQIEKSNRSAFVKYPLTFSLLATLGIAAVIHGFTAVVDTIPFLTNRPILIFLGGLVLLLATGRLYKYLQK